MWAHFQAFKHLPPLLKGLYPQAHPLLICKHIIGGGRHVTSRCPQSLLMDYPTMDGGMEDFFLLESD